MTDQREMEMCASIWCFFFIQNKSNWFKYNSKIKHNTVQKFMHSHSLIHSVIYISWKWDGDRDKEWCMYIIYMYKQRETHTRGEEQKIRHNFTAPWCALFLFQLPNCHSRWKFTELPTNLNTTATDWIDGIIVFVVLHFYSSFFPLFSLRRFYVFLFVWKIKPPNLTV